ncbi:hypothetical protein CSC81_13015 [Tenacibaculum discolor]|uniref:Uncharacterized protein n=1 Tax=Tenacibaculum discolor TaxID=361581 RepID=A0A2G1BRF4_9FLAO|nr:hypothetical protein CSC81_13015 [Tenacibaculum discolor]RLK00392.1 hypothetical protein C8N27_2079 [Tenacibaculum discolor]
MKKLIILFSLIYLASCTNHVNVKIKGHITTSNDYKIKKIEVGQKIVHSPMDSSYSKILDIKLTKDGYFEFEIQRKEMKGDSNFAVIFKEERYETEYKFVDIRKEKEIDLGTVLLKLKG